MKRALYVTCGGLLGLASGYVLWLAAEPWFTDWIGSDADIDRLVQVYLFSQLVLAVAGGFSGNWLHRRLGKS